MTVDIAERRQRPRSRPTRATWSGSPKLGTSIELFTGGGGLARAMRDAGFSHLLVNEVDSHAAATLRANGAVDHKDGDRRRPRRRAWPLIEGDVRHIDFQGWEGRVDVVAGGVPCQPWSLGGAHRGHEDDRNLWPELIRCVRESRPRAVIAENVKGLLRPSFAPYYEYILNGIRAPHVRRRDSEEWSDHNKRLRRVIARGSDGDSECYDVAPYLVNAADYGVPQQRWRVIVVAFRRDLRLAEWNFPAPTHSGVALARAQSDGTYWAEHGLRPPESPSVLCEPEPVDLLRWRTVRDELRGVPEPIGDRLEHPEWLHHYGWPGAREYPGHRPNELDLPAKTVKAGVHGVPGGETVLRRDDGTLRYMTVREVARIMTFPDNWRLAGRRGEQMRQLGNAVPPRLGAVVASAVGEALQAELVSREA